MSSGSISRLSASSSQIASGMARVTVSLCLCQHAPEEAEQAELAVEITVSVGWYYRFDEAICRHSNRNLQSAMPKKTAPTHGAGWVPDRRRKRPGIVIAAAPQMAPTWPRRPGAVMKWRF